MEILLSIKPEYTEKILNGEKIYELRKRFPNKEITKAVIYESSPVSKVVGEFEIEEVLCETTDILWKRTKNSSFVSKEFFDKYFEGKKYGYALKVKNPKRYKEPKLITEYGIKRPPQSFLYIGK